MISFQVELSFVEHNIQLDKWVVGLFRGYADDFQDAQTLMVDFHSKLTPNLEKDITHGKRSLAWTHIRALTAEESALIEDRSSVLGYLKE